MKMLGYDYIIGDPVIRERVKDIAGKTAVAIGIAVIGFTLFAVGYLIGLTCFYYG